MFWRTLCTATLGFFLLATPSRGEDDRILMLDTGGHQASIQALTFTPDGKFIISAGYDKVIRVWDWQEGKTVRTIRGQSSTFGQVGSIYTMALSPDGNWLAAGGLMHRFDARVGEIRLYNFASGELKLLRGHSNVLQSLAFSSNSKLLISGSSDGDAIIWDIQEKKALQRLHKHTSDVLAVAFTQDDARAVTASKDKTLWLWRVADGEPLKEMKGHAGEVAAIAISPRDGSIVSGDWKGEIHNWDGKSGDHQEMLTHQNGDVLRLQYSPDGRLLLACGRRSNLQRIFDVVSRQEQTAYAKQGTTVLGCAFSPTERLAATGGGSGNEIHIWDPLTGETKAVLKGVGRPIWATAFSTDGRSIAWGTTLDYRGYNNRGPLEFAFRLPIEGKTIFPPELMENPGSWSRAEAHHGRWSLQHRDGKAEGCQGGNTLLDILENGQTNGLSVRRTAQDGCEHVTYGFTPDGKFIVSGGRTGHIITYDLDGQKLGEFWGHVGDISAIAPSPDGRYLLSGGDDQMLNLWNLQTRELLVTLFRSDDGEWAVWTPQGYYAGSPGAEKIVGWQINLGVDKAADYVTVGQLRSRLNRPDIVAKAIQLASAEEAVRTSHGTELKLLDLLARSVPHLRILLPQEGSPLKERAIRVKIALDLTPDPVKHIRIEVSGTRVGDFFPADGRSFAPGEHRFRVPLAKGKNKLVITAMNDIGWSKVGEGTLTLTNEIRGELDQPGTLYILAIGVSKYPGIPNWCAPKKNCDLDYTGNDALTFAKTVEERLGPWHEKVVPRVLRNESENDGLPSKTNIINALVTLRLAAQPNDTIAVLFAGHGYNDGPSYRFVSTDAVIDGEIILPSSVVSWHEIEEEINRAKGRRLLFIDTCHSQGGYNERLGNTAYHANILAYSAARWDQLAYESDGFKRGLFTQAVIEGLSGAADLKKRRQVDTADLYNYLKVRVPALAAELAATKKQNPQFFRGRDAEDYTLVEFK